MNIYQVRADVALGWVKPNHDEATKAAWKKTIGAPNPGPPILLGFEQWRRGQFLPVDCASTTYDTGRGFLLNLRARTLLAPLLSSCGEYLPANLDGYDYQWFNCTAWRDVVDQDRVEGKLHSTNREGRRHWSRIFRWAFVEDRLHDLPAVFRVPHRRVTVLLCTDLLKTAVETHDLIGFQFTNLWSSEHGGTRLPENPFGFLFGDGAVAHAAEVDAKRAAARARLGLKPERKRRRRTASSPPTDDFGKPA